MIYFGLLLFFILEYVRPTSYLPGLLVLHLNSIVPGSNFLGTLATRFNETNKFIWDEHNTWIIVTLLALVWGSFLTADVTMYAYSALELLLGYGMAYWVLMSELTTVRRIKGVFMILIAVHVFVAALNPVLFTNPSSRQYVASGFFLGDGNDFALSLNIAVPLCLGLVLDSKRLITKLFWAAAMLLMIACVVLTQSRGGTIALGSMGLYYWLKSQKKMQMAMIAGFVVLAIFAYAPSSYFERMDMIADTEEGSANARLTAWGTAIDMAIDHPVMGVGAGHFAVKYGARYRPADAPGPWMTAHSLYFLALGELGFPGAALILYFFYWNLVANRKLAVELRASTSAEKDSLEAMLSSTDAALIAFAAGAAFLSCLYYPHVYVLCGVLGATRQVVRERMKLSSTIAVEAAPTGMTLHWALQTPAAASARLERIRP